MAINYYSLEMAMTEWLDNNVTTRSEIMTACPDESNVMAYANAHGIEVDTMISRINDVLAIMRKYDHEHRDMPIDSEDYEQN